MMQAYFVSSHQDAVVVPSGITEIGGHKVDWPRQLRDEVKVTVVTVPSMSQPMIWH